MGNDDSLPKDTVDKDFQMQKYLNRGLDKRQVLQIKEAFDCYEPVDGVIQLDKYRLRIEQSSSKDMIGKYLGNKQTMNFEEFFAMEKEVLSSQLQNNPSL